MFLKRNVFLVGRSRIITTVQDAGMGLYDGSDPLSYFRYSRFFMGYVWLFSRWHILSFSVIHNLYYNISTFSAQETIHRQAVVCHRVLRRVQELAQQSQVEQLNKANQQSMLSCSLQSKWVIFFCNCKKIKNCRQHTTVTHILFYK